MRLNDKKNIDGKNYWDNSWDLNGVQSFSCHTRVVENAKWNHLLHDLKGYSGRCLEVGCGSGHFSALLAQEGFNAFLIDYSTNAVRCAKNSFLSLNGRENRRHVVGNAFHLPFADGIFDVVLSCGLLEHFENPIVPVNEMARVLRKGGLFYSDICPKKISLIGILDFLYKSPQGWYERKIDRQEIEDMLRQAGLATMRIFAAGVLPPRNVPLRGRIKLIANIQKFVVERFEHFWNSFDNTKLAELLGFYYYVTARKN